ncbi:MAG: helix-turn-helix domain-containing protein [Candidatus Aminicenantes bacterium]|nr:helix-turn-helix domain-containing protein [Candidatus Aminicenantes bacterium]
MEKRWLKVKTAADLLSLHPQSLNDGLLAGKIPGAKLPGLCWRVDIKAVNEMMEKQIEERKWQK